MPEILVRNLDRQLIERLKDRADQNGRSLQAEVKTILEQSVETPSVEEFRKSALRLQRRLARRRHSDSASLIRQDRKR
jgi:plasmid stability protein